ncbi:DUF4097 family beta strand repeat-containing protein [Aliikangiella coralliicola]|uniref:DUF4097 domain-containing protein n=1 Tax=Aliikangiella coralliicola TaxID=2592383 RepID=A0A545U0E1_9GAMM|nr:DUF4097 family beta strand repeat-containing protein [Aliikangiella coralliicola]TQV82928.1 DUF4097 domain-containing protein [Aliikangiella coralliicola]
MELINKHILAFGAISFLLASVSLSANSADKNKSIEKVKKAATPKVQINSYDWEGKIPESRLVVLKNPYGSIRSRNHSGEKIFMHATYQEIGKYPVRPEFKIEQKEGRLLIEVVYLENVHDKKGKLRGRTDVSILFPDTVSIYAETDSGLIKIDKSASHVEAVSKSGDIKLTTTGLFAARTDSGEIALRLRGIKQMGHSSAKSKSGLIKADVFSDMDIHLTGETAGKITLNRKQQSKLNFQQGNNQSLVKLISDDGDIKVKIISPPELIQSVKPSNVHAVDVDLRNLPKAKLWKPGDPVFDRDDKRDNSKNKSRKKS